MSSKINNNNNNNSIGMVEAKLPPGFRFHPRDVELICDYLMKKIGGWDQEPPPLSLIEVDLNKFEPWDIPETACVGGREWYFYSQRDRKYARGCRTNRATVLGYWKATGRDREIRSKENRRRVVGMRKTLVFYKGRAPKGNKTDWVMHEFRLQGPPPPFAPPTPQFSSLKKQEDWVLCRVFYKSREVEEGIGSSRCDETTSSSSLPGPLMEDSSSYMTFDQSQSSDNNNNEQVPCFSIFNTPNQNNSNTAGSNITTAFSNMDHLQNQYSPLIIISSSTASTTLPPPMPIMPELSAPYLKYSSSSCDKDDHLNKTKAGISSESLFPGMGIPSMSLWSHY